jgi:hypothetical protein
VTARNHHYVPQCYLKGFTKDQKKPRLFVVDRKGTAPFFTHPRNVASRRDFHRINVEGLPADTLESAFSAFEGDLDNALRTATEQQSVGGETKNYLLNLIALIAVKNPRKRENMREFRAAIARKILALSLAFREMWEEQIARARKDGAINSEHD